MLFPTPYFRESHPTQKGSNPWWPRPYLKYMSNKENISQLQRKPQDWNMDKNKMSAVTTDNASNNIKAFSQKYTWIPCFGHNLDLATDKALAIDRVSSTLSRLRKTVSAFSRSPKMSRLLLEKQTDLGLPQKNLLHDTPTRWSSGYDIVERFLEQQQAVSAALATERKKWHLMPRDSDMTTLETVKEVLGPLRRFTDVLSGEKLPTIAAVQVVMWDISSCLAASEDDVPWNEGESSRGSTKDIRRQGFTDYS